MDANSIPEIYLKTFGKFIRQGRSARKLSLNDAADRIGITPSKLRELETGLSPATDILIQVIITAYGGARADAVDNLLLKIAMDRVEGNSNVKARSHLSLVRTESRSSAGIGLVCHALGRREKRKADQ